MSYSFKELAADVAGTIRALGFERAHVIGHSNGGNVALVTLLEHPDVIQTCIPQAANAWVSPDLIEKEPPLFDPDFIERERPLWFEEMVMLHAPLGADYWRKLVLMTLKELISEPNYTPADLAKAALPTLVIQGEVDRVNAPYKHGQFIARHIPACELWIPKGIAHTVHDEILTEWLERVRDFIARRGTADSDKLYRYRLEHHKDVRDGVFDICVSADGVLSGTVLTAEMHAEALELIDTPVTQNNIKILIDENTPWALIKRPVEDIRRKPSILAERISQARMGESARVIQRGDEWSEICMEHDGYMGWVHNGSLHLCAESDVRAYQTQCNAIVIAPFAESRNEDDILIQKIPFAILINVRETHGADSLIQLPDGRIWKINSADIIPLDQRPVPTSDGIKQTLDLIRHFCGIPYLWGGRTPYGFDCSGLAGTFYAFMGVTIPRDADQQYDKGTVVDGKPEPGDLLFFGEKEEDEDEIHISHVAISFGGDEFIHANGSDWGVSYNTFDPAGKLYRKWLHENYRGARRFR
jgi:cell wall-associated NlpC family hydrolase